MEKRTISTEVVVIGGGQAGLVIGYYLQQLQKRFVILDAGEAIGQSWRNRYDSLKLFTTAPFNGLAGMRFPGSYTYFPTKDEVADYLQRYASHFRLPVLLQQPVKEVTKSGNVYFVETPDTVYEAEQVVICTGAFQKPDIPRFSQFISPGINQLHSSQYRNSSQLQAGKTLIVGGGNSGFQIAEELVKQGRQVYFSSRGSLTSASNNPWLISFLFHTGLIHASKYSLAGKKLHAKPEPVMSSNFKQVLNNPNVKIVGATLTASAESIKCEKGTLQDVANIIWATGFQPDYDWLRVPVLDENGVPQQMRGVTQSAGLYFLGLPWMHSRSSGLLGGVSRDAAFLSKEIEKYSLSISHKINSLVSV